MSPLKCHRGACTNAAHPLGWNRMTLGMYCTGCVKAINAHPASGGSLFPFMTSENLARFRNINTVGEFVASN